MEKITDTCKRTADTSSGDAAKPPKKIAVERKGSCFNDLACGEETVNIDALPIEMLSHILSFLTLPGQLKVATVSRRWRHAVDICLAGQYSFQGELLFGNKYVTNELLEDVLSRMPGLHNFGGIRGTDLDINILARHCPRLVKATLSNFQVDESSLEHLCTSCPKLAELVLPFSNCDDACVETVLRGLPGLRSLNVKISKLTGRFLALLPATLRRLELWGAWKLDPAEVERAARCPALTDLDITGLYSSPPGMDKLLQICPKLERLNARDCSKITDSFLEQLPTKTPEIRDLIIDGCTGFTPDGLKNLRRLKELRRLSICNTHTTDAVLERLEGAFHLTELILGTEPFNRSDFSTEALARLVVSCPSLRMVAPSEMDDAQGLAESLIGRLSADRDVSVMMCEESVDELEELLPEDGPLRAVPYSDEAAEWCMP